MFGTDSKYLHLFMRVIAQPCLFACLGYPPRIRLLIRRRPSRLLRALTRACSAVVLHRPAVASALQEMPYANGDPPAPDCLHIRSTPLLTFALLIWGTAPIKALTPIVARLQPLLGRYPKYFGYPSSAIKKRWGARPLGVRPTACLLVNGWPYARVTSFLSGSKCFRQMSTNAAMVISVIPLMMRSSGVPVR